MFKTYNERVCIFVTTRKTFTSELVGMDGADQTCNCRAPIIHTTTGKHSSHDGPPNLPFSIGKATSKWPSLTECTSFLLGKERRFFPRRTDE